MIKTPWYPIIYVRGYAGNDTEIENTAAEPYIVLKLSLPKLGNSGMPTHHEHRTAGEKAKIPKRRSPDISHEGLPKHVVGSIHSLSNPIPVADELGECPTTNRL